MPAAPDRPSGAGRIRIHFSIADAYRPVAAPAKIAIPNGLNTVINITPTMMARYARQPFARFRFGDAQIEPSHIKGKAAKNHGES